MHLVSYMLLLFISLMISVIVPTLTLVTTILTAESVNVGDFQITIFIFLAVMSTVAFVVTYRG